MFRDPATTQITGFLTGIGLAVASDSIPEPTFLPGLKIQRGAIVIDESRLLYPGDLLHEAGHLAVLSPEQRSASDGDFGQDPGYEMAAIAWSYAAAVEIGLDVHVLFHPDGYKGGSEALIDNFTAGRSVGVPMLEWLGLTVRGKYPAMQRWLRKT